MDAPHQERSAWTAFASGLRARDDRIRFSRRKLGDPARWRSPSFVPAEFRRHSMRMSRAACVDVGPKGSGGSLGSSLEELVLVFARPLVMMLGPRPDRTLEWLD